MLDQVGETDDSVFDRRCIDQCMRTEIEVRCNGMTDGVSAMVIPPDACHQCIHGYGANTVERAFF